MARAPVFAALAILVFAVAAVEVAIAMAMGATFVQAVVWAVMSII